LANLERAKCYSFSTPWFPAVIVTARIKGEAKAWCLADAKKNWVI
jgi:hypothetical protein